MKGSTKKFYQEILGRISTKILQSLPRISTKIDSTRILYILALYKISKNKKNKFHASFLLSAEANGVYTERRERTFSSLS